MVTGSGNWSPAEVRETTACPTCGAEKGAPCKNRQWKVAPHLARIDRWRKR